MVQADSDDLDEEFSIQQLFRKADSRDANHHRHGIRGNAKMANTLNRTRISRKKSLKELGEVYLRSGKMTKFHRKLLLLDSQDRLKFFRQKQLRDDKKYRRKLLKSLRKQARKNRKLWLKNRNSSLSASSMILQVNEGREK